MESKSLSKNKLEVAKRNNWKSQISLVFALTLLTIQANSQTQNYFAGNGAGLSNSGSSCVGVGYQALNNSNSGWRNTAIGFWALKWNTSGSSNTAVGYGAMLYNSTGQYNTSLGELALRSNEIGDKNVAIGYAALYSNVSGPNSVAVGHSALHINQVGNNVAVGCSTLYKNEFGNENTALGNYAIENSIAGLRNTAIGSDALRLDTTGNNNTALGRRAGYAKLKYNNCTFLGAEADATGSAFSNATAIGYQTKVDGSNKVRVGNTAITSIGGQVGWTTLSDLRLKENINESKLGLDFILRLNPVTYNYKDEGQKDILYTGLIAQEVDAAAKKEGVEFSGVDKNGEYWGIRYGDLSVTLIKGMQEQQAIIESQQNEIKELRNDINAIKSLLTSDQLQKVSNNTNIENRLEQNQPNPFNTKTTINYDVAEQNAKAVLVIRDLNGNALKEFALAQSGKGSITVNANELAAGTYTYSLEVNGTSVDTKLMVITR